MIDIKNWKEFCLGDLFDIKKGTGFGLKNLPEGSTPLISATTKNNSIVAYTDVEPIFPSNTITVTTDGAGMGYATVQTEAFDIASNAVALIPKNNNVGLYAKFFICSVIRQYANRFSYKDKMNRGQLLQLLIKLPVTSDGQPDWDYMEFYMKKVMEETEEYIRIVGGGTPLKSILLMLASGVSSELVIYLLTNLCVYMVAIKNGKKTKTPQKSPYPLSVG